MNAKCPNHEDPESIAQNAQRNHDRVPNFEHGSSGKIHLFTVDRAAALERQIASGLLSLQNEPRRAKPIRLFCAYGIAADCVPLQFDQKV